MPGRSSARVRDPDRGQRGTGSAALARRWLAARPRSAYHGRADTGEAAFALEVYLPGPADLMVDDPVAAAIWGLASERGPLRPGERSTSTGSRAPRPLPGRPLSRWSPGCPASSSGRCRPRGPSSPASRGALCPLLRLSVEARPTGDRNDRECPAEAQVGEMLSSFPRSAPASTEQRPGARRGDRSRSVTTARARHDRHHGSSARVALVLRLLPADQRDDRGEVGDHPGLIAPIARSTDGCSVHADRGTCRTGCGASAQPVRLRRDVRRPRRSLDEDLLTTDQRLAGTGLRCPVELV